MARAARAVAVEEGSLRATAAAAAAVIEGGRDPILAGRDVAVLAGGKGNDSRISF